MLQSEVAQLAETGQSAISRIEKANYDGWTFKTLICIAEVLRARLRITFEPIEDVVSSYCTNSQLPDGRAFGGVSHDAGTTADTVEVAMGDGTSGGLMFASGGSSARVVVM